MKTFILAVFGMLFLTGSTQVGSLDPTFGNNGIMVFPAGRVLTAPDGSYYLIKRQDDMVTGISWTTVAKYFRSGTLDPAFGMGGYTQLIGVEGVHARVQDDGKLVIAGNTPSDAPWEILPGQPAPWDHYVDRIVFRFTTDGLLDPTFGSSGYVTSSVGRATFDFTRSLTVGNGRLATIGYGISLPGSFVVFDLIDYTGIGQLSLTPLLSPLSEHDPAQYQYHVFFQGTKTLIAASSQLQGTIDAPVIARYNPDKTLDLTFGQNGVINDYTALLTIQGDKIVIPSVYVDPVTGQTGFTLRRYNNDGTPDPQFSTTANQQVAMYPATSVLTVNAIITQDDKVIIGGTIKDPQTGKTGFIIARYNPDGTLDQSFHGDGIVTTFHTDNLQLWDLTIVGNRLSVTGGNVAALYVLDDGLSFSCPPDTTVETAPGTCTSVVNGIDPVGVATVAAGTSYSLTGATTATGTGTASGLAFNKGVTTVTYTSLHDLATTCSFTVTVLDKEAPVISNVVASHLYIWPPNNKMFEVHLDYDVSDNCGWTNTVLSVTSNDFEEGEIKPNKLPAWIIADDHHVQLRADRGKHRDGRVYIITITAMDAAGNQSTQTVQVRVAMDPAGNTNLYTRQGKPALADPAVTGLQVNVFPNPASGQFFITINSSRKEKIHMRVMNSGGSLVETRTGLPVNSRIPVGATYKAGVYLAEFTQGTTKRVLRIVKE
jgi:uncharacterized delta-60 repeat protein